MKKASFLYVLSLFSVGVFSQQFEGNKGKVTFISEAPLSTFEGNSDQLNGLIDLDKGLVDFYLDLNTLKTGIGLRDKHMRDSYLETKKYPFGEFTGQINKAINFNQPVEVKGKFKLHGVEKEVLLKGVVKKIDQNTLEIISDFEILLSDYKIEIPKVVFYELADIQKVRVQIQLKRKVK
jgi:polyisoprenoid-binding protein YceI